MSEVTRHSWHDTPEAHEERRLTAMEDAAAEAAHHARDQAAYDRAKATGQWAPRLGIDREAAFRQRGGRIGIAELHDARGD